MTMKTFLVVAVILVGIAVAGWAYHNFYAPLPLSVPTAPETVPAPAS